MGLGIQTGDGVFTLASANGWRKFSLWAEGQLKGFAESGEGDAEEVAEELRRQIARGGPSEVLHTAEQLLDRLDGASGPIAVVD